MKKALAIIGCIVFIICIAIAYFIFVFLPQKEEAYQTDAARKRISDVYEIAALLEECKNQQGTYPTVQELLNSPEDDDHKDVPFAIMLSQPDQDWTRKPFPFSIPVEKLPAKALIKELSVCLQRPIDLPVDPQRRPYLSPNTYIVLFTNDNSYVVIAFLYDMHKYTSKLAEHVYAFAVSSELGSKASPLLHRMGISPKRFIEIPEAEIREARELGKKVDQTFSNWATMRVSQ